MRGLGNMYKMLLWNRRDWFWCAAVLQNGISSLRVLFTLSPLYYWKEMAFGSKESHQPLAAYKKQWNLDSWNPCGWKGEVPDHNKEGRKGKTLNGARKYSDRQMWIGTMYRARCSCPWSPTEETVLFGSLFKIAIIPNETHCHCLFNTENRTLWIFKSGTTETNYHKSLF